MRSVRVIGWIVAHALAPWSSGVAQNAPLDRIEAAEAWSADGRSRLESLSSIDGMAELPSGSIRISSGPDGVYAVDPSDPSGKGDRWIVVANDGEGPGELGGSGGIVVTAEGLVAVHDAGRDQVELFRPSGEPVRTVRLQLGIGWTKGFAALSAGEFAVSGGTGRGDGGFHRFGATGEHLDSWEEAAPAETRYARHVGTGGPLHAAPDGWLLYSQNAPHRVVRHRFPAETGADPRSRVVAEIPGLLEAPGDDVLVRTVEDGQSFVGVDLSYPKSVAVFALEDGRVLNVVARTEDGESFTTWQLFAPSGGAGDPHELAAQGRVADYEPHFLCADGDVLASRTDDLGVNSAVRLRWRLR